GAGPVVVVEDRPGAPGFAERAARVSALGVTVVSAPSAPELEALVRQADLVVPSPGVPESHPVYALAERSKVALRSEIELGGAEAVRLGRTLAAVTGTNGKTTVTTLITDMLSAARVCALAAGN